MTFGSRAFWRSRLKMKREHLLSIAVCQYNAGSGRFGLASCDDPAWKYRNLRRESTDGNETAAPQESCGQCSKFARWCAGEDRDTALYRRGERGGPPPTRNRINPSCSCDLASKTPGHASQRPGWAFGESRREAESATLADENPATRTLFVLAPIASAGALPYRCKPTGGNAQIWQGCALSAHSKEFRRSFAGGAA
jgi:hypothetical protein